MTDPAFDAAGFVRFDLSTGEIRSRREEPLALLPIDILEALAPGEVLGAASRRWGESHGKDLAERSSARGEPAGMNDLAEHLGGAIALAGLGSARVEVRGDALLFCVEPGEGGRRSGGYLAVLEGFLAGYLSAIGPGDFAAVHIDDRGDGAVFFAGNPKAATAVRESIDGGTEPMKAVDGLAPGGET